jgi:O-antigen/teichoic acid export membrane protein
LNVARAFLGGVKWTGLSAIVVSVVQLIKIAVLARLLSKTDFGLMAIVNMVIGFTNIFLDLGITTAVLYKQEISRNEYNSLFWLNIIFSVLLFLLVMLVSPWIANFYDESELNILIPLTAANIMIAAIGKLYRTIEQKQLNFRLLSFVEICAALISLITGITLAYAGYGVYSLVWSLLIASFITSISFFIMGIMKLPLSFRFHFQETKSFLRIGLYQTGSQVLNYFSREVDILIVGKILGTETLGLYSLAKQLVQKPILVLNPILTKITAPLLAKLQDNQRIVKNTYLKILNLVALVNFPVYSLLAFMAFNIVSIFYGQKYIDAALIVSFLSINYAFRSIGNPVGGLIIARGRTDIGFYWNLFVFAVYPIVVYFSSFQGVYFLAAALAAFRVILSYPGWYMVLRKLISVGYVEYLSHYYLPLITSLVSGVVAFYIVNYLKISNDLLSLIIAGILLSMVYAFLNMKNMKRLWGTIRMNYKY